jgi:hypothetical protein
VPIEDVPDKARRNLMFVATGIIAVWALGIPLDGRLIGVIQVEQIQPWRAWACAVLVLLYCCARYHYAPSTAAGLSEWRTNRASRRSQLVGELVRTAISKRLEGIPQRRVTLTYPHEPTDGFRYGKIVPGHEGAFYNWNGKVEINWAANSVLAAKPSLEVLNKMGQSAAFGFNVKFHSRVRAEIAVWRESLRPGWTTLEFLLPYPLAALALGVALYYLVADLNEAKSVWWLPPW